MSAGHTAAGGAHPKLVNRRLFAGIDGSSLAVFRLAFGTILFWEVLRYFDRGWIDEYFVDPGFHFTYAGFHWVKPWPGVGMQLHFAGLGLLALAIAVGFWQRLAAALFCLGFSYVFLLEKARYLNHFYLVILVSGLLAIVRADRCWSWSSWRRGRTRTTPAWALGLLRTQIGLVYLFAGIAKLNVDWLAAQPLTSWLGNLDDHPLLGPLLRQDWSPWLFSYAGLALDLAAWPLLAWRRTRGATLVALISFHLTNAMLFDIGIFPWMMIAATTLFLEPDWPRRLLRLPGTPPTEPDAAPTALARRAVPAFLALYLGFQFLFPLRHFLYPGPVSWTEEGHAFSWHMKLRSKRGELSYRVLDPRTGSEWIIDPAWELTSWQARKLGGRPDMILRYAHHIARRIEPQVGGPVEVRVVSSASLNARPSQPFIDPAVDLSRIRWGIGHSPWILPLQD